jgi:hypothetical protein
LLRFGDQLGAHNSSSSFFRQLDGFLSKYRVV